MGRCQLSGGEGGHWPVNMGPTGGLGGAVLGGWAEPAASGGGHLAIPPILIICPYPAVPFNACGQPSASLGSCCSSAAHGCPSSRPMPCWVMLVGEPVKWLEALELWWPRAREGGGKGGVVGAPLRPCLLRPAMALPPPTLSPPQLPLPRRGRHPAPGSGC